MLAYIGNMRKFIAPVLLLLCFSLPALAAAPLPPEKPATIHAIDADEPPPAGAATGDIPKEDVKQLIETLESDTARTELLSNLKILLDEQKKDEGLAADALPLTEQIGVRSFISDSVDRYENFLSRHNLSGSVVNQMLGSIIVMIVALLLVFAEYKFHQRVIRLCDRISGFFSAGVGRLRYYARALQWIIRFVIVAVAAYTLASIWGIGFIDRFFASETVRSFVSTGMTIVLVVFLAALLWEGINLYLSYVLHKADSTNNTRSKTLLPIIRNIFFMVFGGLFGLVLLSEIGINVTPLLAGAGVIGVAVGFGAQNIVKDYLSGFTIVLEDLVRVGDVVNLAGFSGSVEQITLRKIQIRDYGGTVYTIPYSEIKVIQNLTKDFSFYVMDINVAYNASIDHVLSVLRQVDEELRRDERFSFMILEPLEIAGVDKFADSAIVIRTRIKTLPIRQWVVGREFNRRMKEAFDANGIEIPFPQRTINVKADPTIAGAILAEAAD